MTMMVRVGGAWKDIEGASLRSGGSWRRLVAIKAYEGGAWRDVAAFTSPLSMTLSQSSITKLGFASSVQTNTTVNAIPTGGASPHTYAWVKQSGGAITATLPTSAATFFRATAMVEDETRTAVFRCTVTDAFNNTASADVTVTLRRGASNGGNQ